MSSTIAAVTTSGGGIVMSGDSSGNLSLLSGATTVVAVTSAGVAVTGTLSATGDSTLTGAITATAGINTPNTFGFKNRIINGGMVIDQRNAGASVTPANATYTLDRFISLQTTASKYSVQQNAGAVTLPVGFANYLGCTSLSAYSVSAGDVFGVGQVIEGYNIADLGWGTANAKIVTLSFQVYSSLTGTFGGSLQNSGSTRSYPFTYSIPVANTWTTISVTIAGDTSGTWLKTTGQGITIIFGIGVGSTYSGTAGSWSGNAYYSATGATSVVGTNGATFYITGVQLEKGSTATSFDFRDYGRELMMCQRYFYKTINPFLIGVASGASTINRVGSSLPVTMRATPSVTFSGTTLLYDGSGTSSITSCSSVYANVSSFEFDATLVTGSATQGRAIVAYKDAVSTGAFSINAEL
jgi:hypothetical protein